MKNGFRNKVDHLLNLQRYPNVGSFKEKSKPSLTWDLLFLTMMFHFICPPNCLCSSLTDYLLKGLPLLLEKYIYS